jgi:hypothetical protein
MAAGTTGGYRSVPRAKERARRLTVFGDLAWAECTRRQEIIVQLGKAGGSGGAGPVSIVVAAGLDLGDRVVGRREAELEDGRGLVGARKYCGEIAVSGEGGKPPSE